MGLVARLRGALDVLVREVLKFGVVGALAYVIDVGLFNLLRFGPGDLLLHKPLTAKVISVTVATCFAWYGNRQWTFRHRRTPNPGRELVQFALINIIGLGIGLACLFVSHYALGLKTPLADNISANGVGLVLSTLFRFWAYRQFVFVYELGDDLKPPQNSQTPTGSSETG
ncbi:MAG: GtrA family protein [Actinomycetales bacterium]